MGAALCWCEVQAIGRCADCGRAFCQSHQAAQALCVGCLAPPPSGYFDGTRVDTDDLGDLIGNLFSRGRAGGKNPPPTGPRRGVDIESDLHLAFVDAIRGATTTVNITCDVRCPDCAGSGAAVGTAPKVCTPCGGCGAVDEDQGFFSFSRPCAACDGCGRIVEQPCPTCKGVGVMHRPRQVKVRIPQGVRDGQRLRVKDKGGAGGNGGPDGDLYVKVHVGTHRLFGRNGDHLTVTVPITPPEAAQGADIEVPTASGEVVSLRVPPGTRDGQTFWVPGHGVSSEAGSGDLAVTVVICVPTDISPDERKVLDDWMGSSHD